MPPRCDGTGAADRPRETAGQGEARLHLIETFRATFGGKVTAEEMAEAEWLVAEKYADLAWAHEFA